MHCIVTNNLKCQTHYCTLVKYFLHVTPLRLVLAHTQYVVHEDDNDNYDNDNDTD